MKIKDKHRIAIDAHYHRSLNEENVNTGVEELLDTFDSGIIHDMRFNNAETIEMLIRFHLTIFSLTVKDLPLEGKMAVCKQHLERFNGVMVDYIKQNSMQ